MDEVIEHFVAALRYPLVCRAGVVTVYVDIVQRIGENSGERRLLLERAFGHQVGPNLKAACIPSPVRL